MLDMLLGMKLRYHRIGENTYEVLRQNSPRKPWVRLGTVRRTGRLPSMQGWCALLEGDGEFGWMPKRRTRDAARQDLLGRS
jgi:hypothetical protein